MIGPPPVVSGRRVTLTWSSGVPVAQRDAAGDVPLGGVAFHGITGTVTSSANGASGPTVSASASLSRSASRTDGGWFTPAWVGLA